MTVLSLRHVPHIVAISGTFRWDIRHFQLRFLVRGSNLFLFCCKVTKVESKTKEPVLFLPRQSNFADSSAKLQKKFDINKFSLHISCFFSNYKNELLLSVFGVHVRWWVLAKASVPTGRARSWLAVGEELCPLLTTLYHLSTKDYQPHLVRSRLTHDSTARCQRHYGPLPTRRSLAIWHVIPNVGTWSQ